MRYIKLLVASVMLVSMTACLADKTELEMQGYIKTINVFGPEEIAFEQISGSGQTKATSVENGSALVFRWAAGDTLGIFPNKGNQVEFPITTQESSTSASFDGGGWALRNNASYAAYYPFSVWNYFQNNKTVIMDYSGQVQDGNGSFAHLSAYDYLASAKTTPQNGSVTFQMDRQGSILYIDIVVPEPATITSLTISCDEAIFVEKAALDISGDTPEVTPIETKESLTLAFENTVTTYQNETVRAYMAVQPLDFSSKTVTATLVTDAGTYTAPVVSRVVNKGKAAFLRFSDSFTDDTIPGAVDLGLPSGLKWATCNVGATAPEEYGDYFAWGETEPYYSSQDPLTWKSGKTGYNWSSYKFELGTGYQGPFSKYVTNSSYGTVDNNTVLDPEDDAAAVNWGGRWRMPTDEEWTELRTECTWTWTTHNGVNGRLVTGPNGNSIFLPAAGSRYHDLFSTGSNGSYWSSSLYTGIPCDAWYVYFNSDEVSRDDHYRCIGRSVRPVTDEGVRVSVTNVSLDNDSLNLTIDETATLTATVTPSNATQPTVIWSSSDNTVATVDYTGKVTAVAAGTATITAKTYDGGFTATCSVTVTDVPPAPGAENGYEWVDLGLPSGLKWATCNVGANAPEEYGDYFAWGETEPYYTEGHSQDNPCSNWKTNKTGYDWASYKFELGTDYHGPFSKYVTNSSYGTVDNKTVLDPEDDAAAVNWGGTWRMPTDDEWSELLYNCTWTWTTQNGIYGYLVTGTNRNSIFLPAAGRRSSSTYLYSTGSFGLYWSSFLGMGSPYYACELYFYSDNVDRGGLDPRYYGQSVRPVTDCSSTIPSDNEDIVYEDWN